jgi:hypothetical protein
MPLRYFSVVIDARKVDRYGVDEGSISGISA